MYVTKNLGESSATTDCSGWERDPQSFAKRVADHYLRTVLKLSLAARTIRPPQAGSVRWEVSYPNDIVVAVIFAKGFVAAAKIFPWGPIRHYNYSCTPQGDLLLSDRAPTDQSLRRNVRSRDSVPSLAGFGTTVEVPTSGNSPQCRAEERRIHPILEPPAAELVNVDRRHGGPRQLHRDAYSAYQRLKAAAEADGIPANLLTMTSGYRSVASQRTLWEAALQKYGSPQAARRWVAPPGGSPHHTGRAIDFYLGGRNNSENVAQLRQTATYRWLVCNAARFGFYPYAAEPWHWEYNPPRGSGAVAGFYSSTDLGEPPVPHPALAGLVGLSTAQTAANVTNALGIVRLISQFHSIPWRVPFVVLEHEGGVRIFNHNDGVMQTTDGAKTGAIRSMPRLLKLTITGRSLNDLISDADLNRNVHAEFSRRLAVQIACGIQELKNNLDRFNNYIALALIAYNAGAGNAARVVTRGHSTSRPRGTSDALWEEQCRFAAMLYHQPVSQLRITRPGIWQCDKNIPAWFQHYAVFDPQSGVQLIAFKYLRSFQACIPATAPARAECNATTHGDRRAGSGDERCNNTRVGALDKIYDPAHLTRSYQTAVGSLLPAITDDGFPLKAQNGQLVKMPHTSGPVSPQGAPFDGFTDGATL